MAKDILIVEDGLDERERLSKLFSDAGYGIVSCDSVAQAEDELQRGRFRLAILDIGLSDKSGSHLFNSMRRGESVSSVIILTGNPSVHLKERFMSEGALDYIVKGSPAAQNDKLLSRVKEVIGSSSTVNVEGIDLEQFLSRYVDGKSRDLFLDQDGLMPACSNCGSRSYVVSFSKSPQLPPEIQGQVMCANCAELMDPEVE